MLIVGIVLVLVACGLLVVYYKKKKELDGILSTETSSVEFLTKLCNEMTRGFKKGDFNYATEVKGKVVCSDPITSELSKTECVYYTMQVTRKYEETYYETDQSGKRRRRTRSGSETVSSNTRHVSFMVDDGTGQIQVKPAGAKFIAEKMMSRFEPPSGTSGGGVINLGALSFKLPSIQIGGDRRTTGYQFEEHAIRNGSDIYVLGDASDKDGALCLQDPIAKGHFIISTKGEDTLLKEGKAALTWMMVGAALSAVTGIALLVTGIVKA